MIASPSARFTAALRDSHVARARVQLYEFDPTPFAPPVPVGDPLPIEGGNLTLDAGANVMRTLEADVVLPPRGTTARQTVESINVVSAEVRLEYGIDFGDEVEWVQVGQLRCKDLRSTLTSGTRPLVAVDRMILPADFPLVTPYACTNIAGAQLSYHTAARDLINAAFPNTHPLNFEVGSGLTVTSGAATELIPVGTVFEGDRLQAVAKITQAYGAILVNDNLGRFRFDPVVRSGEPVWEMDAGPNGVLSDMEMVDSRDDRYNAVALTCEPGSGQSIFVFLVDSDPLSPTYYNGPFGKRPTSRRNDTIGTQYQAILAAQAILDQLKGEPRDIEFEGVYNPLLEPFDLVRFRASADFYSDHIIDQLTVPLGGGQMTGRTRKRIVMEEET